ncbi:MAG: hypothetical protein ACE5R6_04845 [Candidatus Heimdallarchaeota archaeon]
MNFFLVLIFVLIVVIFCLFLGNFFGAPWAPTSKSTVRKMLTMAEVKPGEVVYDLGSGD